MRGTLWFLSLTSLLISSYSWAGGPSSRPHRAPATSRPVVGKISQNTKAQQFQKDFNFLQGEWRCPLVVLKRDVGLTISKAGLQISLQKGQALSMHWVETRSLGEGKGEFLVYQDRPSKKDPKIQERRFFTLTFARRIDDSVRFIMFTTEEMYARDGQWKNAKLRRLGSNLPQRCVRKQVFQTIQTYSKKVPEKDLMFCRAVVKGQRDALRAWILRSSRCQREMCLLVAWQSLFERMSTCLENRGINPYSFMYDREKQQRALEGLWTR
ncbi:MAG: hypothetical protein H6728_06930 [Myxococcales bacterium]|nr:hypothetical protein [Myxococcales bacterium]